MRAQVLLSLLAAEGTRPASAFAFLQPLGASIPLQLRHNNNSPSDSSLSLSTAQANNKWTETEEVSSLTVVELKDLLREKGLKTSGHKSELILRLRVSSLENTAPPATATPKEAPVPKRVPKTRKKSRNKFLDIDSAIDNIMNDNEGSSSNGSSNGSSSSSTSDSSDESTFQDIKVPARLVARLSEMGLTTPTPIQREAIPKAIVGRDVMGLAQTGTGKTLAFGVPLVAQMLNNNSSRPKPKSVRGLVLAPTRELANQIAVQLRTLTEGSPIGTMVVVGGKNITPQINKLKTGTDLLVATPGRLIDLMDRRALTLSDTTFLVLDEADLMLDMGFLPSLRKVVKMLPPKRQTMLFSATMSKNMNEVARSYLTKPVRVEIARAGKTADKVTQQLHFVARPDKDDKLIALLRENPKDDRSLVFGRTKHGMEKLSKKLIAAGFKAGSIHGNKSQSQRDRAIAAFKSGDMKVLVATDVAARGLDIPDVKHVYNYELPNTPEAYVHRIGRTARAGKEGAAVAFCSMEEMDDLLAIQKVTGTVIPVVSGTPWSQTESRRAKDSIKQTKQTNQRNRQPKNSNKKKSARGPSVARYSRGR